MQTKAGAFLLVLMFCCRPSCLCGPKEEREVPAWSRSHPLLIEHLSLLVMDVRESCSCVGTNGGDRIETDSEIEQKQMHRVMYTKMDSRRG